ncbi:MAG: glucose-1-phosphate cytidylyltransferase [Alphaproteobacteria bacterium]|uniref:Glucose-1-phosphate cytidylyltransferase n=1 Tax=Candidatus Nitrobium versatile TaxID=2884831 RepID=A0A953J7Q4_9BACT|nr:glucose-1-phosphate cytidylyltransferase [Candidatus Nitrobium versatile]
MKVVILAGGLGTRLSEETVSRPKPMVEIGGKPILWHIMRIYYAHGFKEFIICCGHKGHMIKQYFSDYFLHMSDITFDMKRNKFTVHQNGAETWKVTLVDTGEKAMTGGRLKRVRDYIGAETFCFTYGDGVCDINIRQLVKFHQLQNTLATLTAVQPPGRFGAISLKAGQNKITSFREKPKGDGAWINGGFFVLEPAVIDYIEDDMTVWEQEPLMNLARDGMLSAYKHYGFWQSMDTLRDKVYLEELWNSGSPPWKVW